MEFQSDAFRATKCGKLHDRSTGAPLGHGPCQILTPSEDPRMTMAVTYEGFGEGYEQNPTPRRPNPHDGDGHDHGRGGRPHRATSLPIRSRDDGDGEPRGHSLEDSVDDLARQFNLTPERVREILEKERGRRKAGSDGEGEELSRHTSQSRFSKRHLEPQYDNNPTDPVSGEESSCGCEKNNPVPESAFASAKPSAKPAREGRCKLLDMMYRAKNPGKPSLSCDELERIEGPSLNAKLSSHPSTLAKAQQRGLMPTNYAVNPVPEEVASSKAPAKEAQDKARVWRDRVIPLSTGQRNVLASLKIGEDSPNALRLQQERTKNLSLSMLDAAIPELVAMRRKLPDTSRIGDLIADLRDRRKLWRTVATASQGSDSRHYDVSIDNVKI